MKQPELRPTETQLLQLLARGKSVKVIAAEIQWTISKTKSHLVNIYKKLGVNTSTAAVAWYMQHREHTRQQPDDAIRHYRRALVASDFMAATNQWIATPLDDRPAEARIYVCVMYLLQNKGAHAMEEANALTGQEAGLVFMLQQWLAGDDNALPMVRNLLSAVPAGARAKQAGLLALYFGGLRKNLADISAAASHALVIDLEHETR